MGGCKVALGVMVHDRSVHSKWLGTVQLGGADVFLLLGMVEEQPSCKCSTLCTVSTLYSVLPLYPCAQARTRVALLSDE